MFCTGRQRSWRNIELGMMVPAIIDINAEPSDCSLGKGSEQKQCDQQSPILFLSQVGVWTRDCAVYDHVLAAW